MTALNRAGEGLNQAEGVRVLERMLLSVRANVVKGAVLIKGFFEDELVTVAHGIVWLLGVLLFGLDLTVREALVL